MPVSIKLQNLVNPDQTINATLPDDLQKPVYSNYISLSIQPEELYLAFFFMCGDATSVVSRVVLSLPHAKRMLLSLEKVLKDYEQKYGEIRTEIKPK